MNTVDLADLAFDRALRNNGVGVASDGEMVLCAIAVTHEDKTGYAWFGAERPFPGRGAVGHVIRYALDISGVSHDEIETITKAVGILTRLADAGKCDDQLLTISQAAHGLGLTRAQVENMVETGQLLALDVRTQRGGHSYKVRESDVQAILDEREEAAA